MNDFQAHEFGDALAAHSGAFILKRLDQFNDFFNEADRLARDAVNKDAATIRGTKRFHELLLALHDSSPLFKGFLDAIKETLEISEGISRLVGQHRSVRFSLNGMDVHAYSEYVRGHFASQLTARPIPRETLILHLAAGKKNTKGRFLRGSTIQTLKTYFETITDVALALKKEHPQEREILKKLGPVFKHNEALKSAFISFVGAYWSVLLAAQTLEKAEIA